LLGKVTREVRFSSYDLRAMRMVETHLREHPGEPIDFFGMPGETSSWFQGSLEKLVANGLVVLQRAGPSTSLPTITDVGRQFLAGQKDPKAVTRVIIGLLRIEYAGF
jgi:hypothetical protein